MIGFCWHKWGKWSEVIGSYGGSLHQVRKCEKCGNIKRRKAVGLTTHLEAHKVNDALKEKS